MAKVPIVAVLMACIQVGLSLLCSMVLLSSIIAWISVQFSGPLPHALGFILGVLSLVNAIATIVLIGASNYKKPVAIVSLLVSMITFIASVCLFIPWVAEYGDFCSVCSELQQTQSCVDNCDDECCFLGMSRGLAVVMVIFSAFTVVTSIIGIISSTVYLRFSSESDSSKRR